jgi:hypothetical protein
MNRIARVLCLAFSTWWCVAAPAQQYGVELTPFGGFQFGGRFENSSTGEKFELDEDFSYGLMVDVDLDRYTQLELYWSRQETEMNSRSRPSTLYDIDVSYFHAGVLQILDDSDEIKPYVVGTLGITYLDPDARGVGSKTRFSMAGGGGVKLMASENVGFRFDGRVSATFNGGGGGISCGQGCTVFIDGDVSLQMQLSAGVTLRF